MDLKSKNDIIQLQHMRKGGSILATMEGGVSQVRAKTGELINNQKNKNNVRSLYPWEQRLISDNNEKTKAVKQSHKAN